MTVWILSLALLAVTGNEPDCLIVHFTAKWCEPCQQLQPALDRLQQAGYKIQQVDTDQQPQLVQQFRVENLPTLVILSQGREADRIVGAATLESIERRVARVAARTSSGPTATVPVAGTGISTATGLPQSEPAPLTPSSMPNHAGPIVRGQSATLGAFPMLASAAISAAPANHIATNQVATSQIAANQIAAAKTLQLTPDQAIARAAAATVRIRVDEANTTAFGTGTIVDMHGDEALVLTCGHIFRDMTPGSQLTIDLFAGTPHEQNLPAQLIDFKAEEEDIGLVSFRAPVRIEPVDLLPAAEQLSVGQPAFSFGCDHGADPTRRDTQVKSIDRYIGAANVQIVGAAAVGRSGGGLFDLQGRLIGVCNAADATDDEGIYAAAAVVYSQIERLGLGELFAGSQASTNGPSAFENQFTSTQDSGRTLAEQAAAAVSTSGWPDAARAEQAVAIAAAQVPVQSSPADGRVAAAGTAEQLICIIRDASGKDRTLTIDAPPAQLLETLQQQSRR